MLPASTATHPGTITSHCQSNEAIIGEEKKERKHFLFSFVLFLGRFENSGSFQLPCVWRMNWLTVVVKWKIKRNVWSELVWNGDLFFLHLCLPLLPGISLRLTTNSSFPSGGKKKAHFKNSATFHFQSYYYFLILFRIFFFLIKLPALFRWLFSFISQNELLTKILYLVLSSPSQHQHSWQFWRPSAIQCSIRDYWVFQAITDS